MSITIKGKTELDERENETYMKMKKLRLSVMAETFKEQILNPNSTIASFSDRIAMLVDAEVGARDSKKMKKIVSRSCMKYPNAYLDQSIYDPERKLNTQVIEHLSTLDEWLQSGMNLLLTGATGTGKTWLANALMIIGASRFKTVMSYKTQKLMLEMDQHSKDGTLLQFENELASYDLLFLDDFGLADNSVAHSRYMFEVLDSRSPYKPTIVASQVPVANWYGFFKDDTYADASLDRLINHAYRIPMEGPSQRKKHRID